MASRTSRRTGRSTGGPKPAAAAPRPSRPVWPYALLLAAGLVLYSNGWTGPFVFDDRATILDNTQIRDLADLGRVFAPPVETPVAGRPLANLTFAINHALGGLDVTGYHGVNIGLHLIAALLLFGVLRRSWPGSALGPALAATAIWLVHPLNTEAVDYVSQRTETLMACAMLLTLYASIRALDYEHRIGWTTGAVVACAAGMACKETMAVAPVAVLLYDRAFPFDSLAAAWRARWRLYLGLASTWVVLAALQLTSPRSLSAGFTAPDAAPWTYLLNQTRFIAHYLRLSVWPDHLALFYGPPQLLTLSDVWPYALGLLALFALTAWAFVRHPRAGFLGAWFFLTLAPASSIVPIVTEAGAERRMYLPLMAVVVAAVAMAVTIARRWPMRPPAARYATAGLVIAIALPLSARTFVRNHDYISSLRLAETTAAGWPTPAADSMLGTELAAAGRLDDAETTLRRASVSYEPARYYLGTVLAAKGQSDAAIVAFDSYLRTALPSLVEVRKAHELLGDLYARTGRWPDAIEQYRAILARDPDDASTHGRLADALVSTRAYADAVPHYQALLAVRPSDVRALGGLGIALAQSGEVDQAIAAFQRAVDVDPRNPRAQQNLARALLAAGRRNEARAHAEQAAALDPRDESIQALLAAIR